MQRTYHTHFIQTEHTHSPLYREALLSMFVIAAFFGLLAFAYIAF